MFTFKTHRAEFRLVSGLSISEKKEKKTKEINFQFIHWVRGGDLTSKDSYMPCSNLKKNFSTTSITFHRLLLNFMYCILEKNIKL